MSKKLKYILSVMLALVIMLAPMSALTAKAAELPPGVPELSSDIMEHYILRGTIITESGDTLTYQEETIDAHFMMDHEYNYYEEAAYFDALGQVDAKLNAWAKQMGYEGLGSIARSFSSSDVTSVYYDADGNEVSADEYDYKTGYYSEAGNVTYICKYYYNAQTGSSHEFTYEVNYSSLDFDECENSEILFPVDCLSADEITGVFVRDASTSTEGTMSAYFSDGFNMPVISLTRDFFADLSTGTYTLVVTFTDNRESSGTPLYVTKWSLDCISGSGANYTPESGQDLVFVFDAHPGESIDHVAINGSDAIPSDMYSVQGNWDEKCFELTIKAEYLESLVQGGVKEALINPHFVGVDRYSNAAFSMYSYEVIEGKTQDYDAEAGGDIVIRIDGPDEEAEEVLVDGTAIGSENYTISHGSTVVTLKEDYLNTLSAGEHKVKVNYSNGAQSEEATITVAETTPDESSESSENSESSTTGSESSEPSESSTNESSSSESSNEESSATESSTESSASQSSNSEPSNSETSNSEASNSDTSSSATESSTTSDGGSSDGPKTGDNNGIATACILMMISMIGIVGVTVLKKKTAVEK